MKKLQHFSNNIFPAHITWRGHAAAAESLQNNKHSAQGAN